MHVVTKRCGNCRTELKFMQREYLQLGKTGFLTGDWSNLLAGALDVEIWCCPNCGKIDFYQPRGEESSEEPYDAQVVVSEDGSIAQIVCPNCGVEFDMDTPKCPCCGEKNSTIF